MKVFVVVCWRTVLSERIFVNAGVFENVADATKWGSNYDDYSIVERNVE